MNRISGFSSVSRSSTAASEGNEVKEEKPQGICRHGHRKASVVATSSQLLAAHKTAISDRQGGASLAAASRIPRLISSQSLAAAHMARKTSTAVSSAQQPVGVSMGAMPRQHHRPGTREATTQTSPAFAPSDTRKASCTRQTQTSPVLPQQLSAKGYHLTSVDPFAQGTVQSVYLLEKRTTNGFEASGLVVKFPSPEGKAFALYGLEIQEMLANSDNGDQYFVPVVEKVIEDNELICHVEPEGTPIMEYIEANKFNLKQRICMISQTFKAVERMHAQGIANLDIKVNNLILKNPIADIQVRFCDFDFAIVVDEIDKATIVPIGTWEYMCSQVLQEELCSPGMADLWACTLTSWVLMTSRLPVLHWIIEVLNTTERGSRVLPALIEYLGLSEQDHASEGEPFPDDRSMMSDKYNSMKDCLFDYLRIKKTEDERKRLQLFFWKHLELPVDIDNLKLPSAEGYILKEMLSIMFFSSTYSDKFKKIMSLITAASRCADLFAENPELDEAKVLKLIQVMGYQPYDQAERLTDATQQLHLCSHLPDRSDEEEVEVLPRFSGGKQSRQVNDFARQRLSAFEIAEQTASLDDLKGLLVDYLAKEGSLDSLEKKDDCQLSNWLKYEWQKRCQHTFPRFKQAC